MTLTGFRKQLLTWLSIPVMLGFFLAIAVWVIWPTPFHFFQALPTGDSPIGTVPMLNAWTLWWNAESFSHSFAGYWNAPIFAPSQGTFGFSDPQPAMSLAAPLVFLSTLPAAYNSYLLLAITLNGWLAFRLLRNCQCTRVAAMCGGIAMSLHPLAIDNLEAIQLVPLAGILWAIDVFLRIGKRPRSLHAVEFAAALLLTACLSLHHFLFLCLLLPPMVICLLFIPARDRNRNRSRQLDQATNNRSKQANPQKSVLQTATRQKWHALSLLAIGLVLAGMATSPWIIPMHRIHEQYQFVRNPETIRILSANLSWWLETPRVWQEATEVVHQSPLLPGWLRTILAASAWLFFGLRKQLATRLLTVIAATSFCLSFGNQLQVGNWIPWEFLCDWIPPFARVRSPYRFAYFTQLAVILLAALTVDRLLTLVRYHSRQASARLAKPAADKRQGTTRSQGWFKTALIVSSRFALACLLLGLAFDVPPPRSFLVHVPTTAENYPWIGFLQEKSSPEDQLLCLPVAASLSEVDCEVASRWMMYATLHGRPILNGYSGYFPDHWQGLRARLNQQPLTPSLVQTVREMGTDWVVVRKSAYAWQLTDLAGKLQLAYEDEGIQIFQVL